MGTTIGDYSLPVVTGGRASGRWLDCSGLDRSRIEGIPRYTNAPRMAPGAWRDSGGWRRVPDGTVVAGAGCLTGQWWLQAVIVFLGSAFYCKCQPKKKTKYTTQSTNKFSQHSSYKGTYDRGGVILTSVNTAAFMDKGGLRFGRAVFYQGALVAYSNPLFF